MPFVCVCLCSHIAFVKLTQANGSHSHNSFSFITILYAYSSYFAQSPCHIARVNVCCVCVSLSMYSSPCHAVACATNCIEPNKTKKYERTNELWPAINSTLFFMGLLMEFYTSTSWPCLWMHFYFLFSLLCTFNSRMRNWRALLMKKKRCTSNENVQLMTRNYNNLYIKCTFKCTFEYQHDFDAGFISIIWSFPSAAHTYISILWCGRWWCTEKRDVTYHTNCGWFSTNNSERFV